MRSIRKFSLLFIIVLFYSCEDEPLSTIISTEDRQLPHFSKIHLDGVGDVDYYVSSEYKIEVTTHIDLLHRVKTYVKQDELHIDLKSTHDNIKTIHYKVFAPEVVEFKNNGVGDIESMDPIEADHLTVLQDGVGKIRLDDVLAESVYARLSDVGDIILSGEASEFSYRLDGVGTIHAFDLIAVTGEASLEGVGDIELFATNDLTIHHDGVGKIYYKGSPDIHYSGNNNNVVGID